MTKHARLLTGDLSDMERSDGERIERLRRSESTPNGTGSEYDSAESGAYSEDDYDDSAYGTMASFVPTLVLERLRSEGEAAMSNQPSGAAEAVADAVEGANVPKVSSLLRCSDIHWRRLMLEICHFFFNCWEYTQHRAAAVRREGMYLLCVLYFKVICGLPTCIV